MSTRTSVWSARASLKSRGIVYRIRVEPVLNVEVPTAWERKRARMDGDDDATTRLSLARRDRRAHTNTREIIITPMTSRSGPWLLLCVDHGEQHSVFATLFCNKKEATKRKCVAREMTRHDFVPERLRGLTRKPPGSETSIGLCPREFESHQSRVVVFPLSSSHPRGVK